MFSEVAFCCFRLAIREIPEPSSSPSPSLRFSRRKKFSGREVIKVLSLNTKKAPPYEDTWKGVPSNARRNATKGSSFSLCTLTTMESVSKGCR